MASTRDIDAERLKALCAQRDKAVAAIQAELDRQSGKTRSPLAPPQAKPRTATTGVQASSYTITCNYAALVSQAPRKGITPSARDAELRQIRARFESQRQLTILQARVMSQWQDI
jgi:hypothetical protein